MTEQAGELRTQAADLADRARDLELQFNEIVAKPVESRDVEALNDLTRQMNELVDRSLEQWDSHVREAKESLGPESEAVLKAEAEFRQSFTVEAPPESSPPGTLVIEAVPDQVDVVHAVLEGVRDGVHRNATGVERAIDKLGESVEQLNRAQSGDADALRVEAAPGYADSSTSTSVHAGQEHASDGILYRRAVGDRRLAHGGCLACRRRVGDDCPSGRRRGRGGRRLTEFRHPGRPAS